MLFCLHKLWLLTTAGNTDHFLPWLIVEKDIEEDRSVRQGILLNCLFWTEGFRSPINAACLVQGEQMNTTIIASKCHKGHVLMISNTTHLIVCKTKSTVNWLIIHHFLLLAHLFLHYLVFRKINALTRPQNRKRKSLLDVLFLTCSRTLSPKENRISSGRGCGYTLTITQFS